jgi:hypothetical protein
MAAVALKQNADGSMGLQGGDRDNGGFININIEYNAASIDKVCFVATRAYVVQGISGSPTVAGSDGGAVTAAIKKASGTTAIASGTALHSSTMNLKGTADTVQNLTLSTTSGVTSIAAGDRIGVDFTGTMTAAVGCITVCLAPA